MDMGWVDVRDFGAVGDGITDDTVAIQAAANAGAISGKPIYIPAGKYLISGTIYFYYDATNNPGFPNSAFPTSLVFEGVNALVTGSAGANVYSATVFNYTGAGVAFEVDDTSGSEQQHSTKLRNFSILTGASDYGISLKHFKKLSRLENVSIFCSATGGKGILLDNCYLSGIKDVYIQGASTVSGSRSTTGITIEHSSIGGGLNALTGVTTKGFVTGIDIDCTNATVLTRLEQCQANYCDVGINIADGTLKTVITACYFEQNDKDIVDNGVASSIVHNYTVNTESIGVEVTANAYASLVEGNRIGLKSTEAGAIGITVDSTNIQHNVNVNSILGSNAGHIGIQFANDPSRVQAVNNHFVGTFALNVDLSGLAGPAVYPSVYNIGTEANYYCNAHVRYIGGTLASAATIDTTGFQRVTISGVAAVSTINGNQPDKLLILRFSGLATISNGATIQLAGGANFVAASTNDVLVLYGDGAVWYEISRSAN